ncbi:MAG: hypothetical protein E7660_02175 [Ruminococcaceae bacterium]|nr:hypothetical protein [Oscillospiraceae bacterium]
MKSILRTAVITAIIFALIVPALSPVFDYTHDCHIDHCFTCVQIKAATELFKNLTGAGIIFLHLGILCLQLSETISDTKGQNKKQYTLTELRVKLNN